MDLKQELESAQGWDIVLGNPPYTQIPKGKYSSEIFPFSEGKDKGKQNLYKVFAEHAYNLTAHNGIFCLITQSSIMCDLSASYTRELLLTQTAIKQLIEFPKIAPTKEGQVFKTALQGTCILLCTKQTPAESHTFKLSISNDKTTIDKPLYESVPQNQIAHLYPQRFEIPLIKKGEMALIAKIKHNKVLLGSMLKGTLQGNINTIHLKKILADSHTGFYILKGENIHRYFLDNNFMNCQITKETQTIVKRNQNAQYIIAMQGITGTTDTNRIHCTLLESKSTKNFVFLHSTKILFVECREQAKFLVGLLNSKLLNWLFKITSTNNNVNLYELESLPIPKITKSNQKIADKIITLVGEILNLKAKDSTTNTSKLESEIDSLVYKLYNLTDEEIKIIER